MACDLRTSKKIETSKAATWDWRPWVHGVSWGASKPSLTRSAVLVGGVVAKQNEGCVATCIPAVGDGLCGGGSVGGGTNGRWMRVCKGVCDLVFVGGVCCRNGWLVVAEVV